jgi:hypothetical protein
VREQRGSGFVYRLGPVGLEFALSGRSPGLPRRGSAREESEVPSIFDAPPGALQRSVIVLSDMAMVMNATPRSSSCRNHGPRMGGSGASARLDIGYFSGRLRVGQTGDRVHP